MPYKPIAISRQSVCKNPLKRTIFPQVFLHFYLQASHTVRWCDTGQPLFSKLVTAPQQNQNPPGYLGEQFCVEFCKTLYGKLLIWLISSLGSLCSNLRGGVWGLKDSVHARVFFSPRARLFKVKFLTHGLVSNLTEMDLIWKFGTNKLFPRKIWAVF